MRGGHEEPGKVSRTCIIYHTYTLVNIMLMSFGPSTTFAICFFIKQRVNKTASMYATYWRPLYTFSQPVPTIDVLDCIVKMPHVHFREIISTTHILFNCQQLKTTFWKSGLYPNSTINTFPTFCIIQIILFRWPISCWRVQLVHLSRRSRWGIPHTTDT